MLCIQCGKEFQDGHASCPYCGTDVPETWEVLKIVYPPEDAIIKGMLESCGIPVILQHEALGPVQGITFGPLGEVRVLVPGEKLEEAQELLQSKLEEPEPEKDSDNQEDTAE